MYRRIAGVRKPCRVRFTANGSRNDAVKNENAPVQYPMDRGVPSSASCTDPSAVGAVGKTSRARCRASLDDQWLSLFQLLVQSPWQIGRDFATSTSTASVAGSTVMAEIAISISHRDGTTVTATGGIRLELRKLLIAIRYRFSTGCCSRSDHHR